MVKLLVMLYVGAVMTLMQGIDDVIVDGVDGGIVDVPRGAGNEGVSFGVRKSDDEQDEESGDAACGVGDGCAGKSTIQCGCQEYITWLLYW